MYPAIRSYGEQAFDNEGGKWKKKNVIIKKSLRSIQSQGVVEQAKKIWRIPHRGSPGCDLRPHQETGV